jgi:glycosyltransferase involved in cell wall biosynthesis
VNVLYVIDSLDRGGSEQSLVELVGALMPLGVTPTVFVLRESPHGLEPTVRALGCDLVHAKASAPPRRLTQLRRVIAATEPDVVHTSLFESDQIGRVAALRSGARVVTSLVNTLDDPARRDNPAIRPWKLRLVSRIDGFTARHFTHHFHAVSHTVARSAIAAFGLPPERITVIERGRDVSRLGEPSAERRQRVRAALGIAPTDEVVLAVGRQEHQKGHRFLLAAFEQLAAARRSAVLLVAGRVGASTAELERQRAASPVAERIHLLGMRPDVPDLLAAADVFALPSLYEGLPGALIEAMGLARSIVASDIDPVRELVEPDVSAMLVPPGDTAALAAALVRCLDDEPVARRLAASARDAFLARFTLHRSAEKMVMLYERVLGAAHR